MWMPEAVDATCPPGVENPNGPIPPNIYPGLSGLPLPGNLTFCEWQVAILTPMIINQYSDQVWDLAQVRACVSSATAGGGLRCLCVRPESMPGPYLTLQADAKAWLKANGWPSK